MEGPDALSNEEKKILSDCWTTPVFNVNSTLWRNGNPYVEYPDEDYWAIRDTQKLIRAR